MNNIFYVLAKIDTRTKDQMKKWETRDNWMLDGIYTTVEEATTVATKLVEDDEHDELYLLTVTKKFKANPKPLTVTDLV